MTDRELLELAAKAAGWGTSSWVWSERAEGFRYRVYGEWVVWSPLTDDGDALRLAVKLRINIEYLADMGGRSVGVNCWPRGRGDCGISEDGPDPLAATRRAIVRAAAEIGRQMP